MADRLAAQSERSHAPDHKALRRASRQPQGKDAKRDQVREFLELAEQPGLIYGRVNEPH